MRNNSPVPMGAGAILAFTLLVGAVVPGVTQTADRAAPSAERHEGTIIGGKPPPASSFERCVNVEIGNDGAFGCLNQQLKRQVDRVNPSLNLPPIDARSPDIRVGNVNEAAVRQQYGPNYGRSVIPYRPTVVYGIPRR